MFVMRKQTKKERFCAKLFDHLFSNDLVGVKVIEDTNRMYSIRVFIMHGEMRENIGIGSGKNGVL